MVEEILQWLKNISIFLIFMTTVLNLIPEKEDKKPVQFFLGIVMVLIFFQPVLKAGGLEQKMAQTLDRLTLEEEAAAMENVQIRAESFEKQYYVGAWEKETERQIRMYLSESGIPGAAVSVTLEPGNTGEAKEIRIEAPMRQTSIYREEQKKQREMLDEKLTEIKSVLSEVYGTDPAHIMVDNEVIAPVTAVLHVADVVFLALNLNIRPLLDQVGNLFDIFNELTDDADARDILHLLLHLFGRNALSLHFFQNTGNTLHTAAHTLDR